MILMVAPAPFMAFGGLPSGSLYVSDQYSLIRITNDSAADQLALQDAGCFTLSPFGGWGNFGFLTLADLYAADTGSILPNIAGFPQYTVVTIFSDPTSGDDGTWTKTGSGAGSGNWTQVSTSTLASLSAEVAASIPWNGATWAQVAQVKIALQNAGEFETVEAAVTADPTQPVNAWWTTGGIATVTGTLGAFIKTTLGSTTTEMNTLWAAATAVAY
jgi:hypothetical protein